MRVQAKVYSLEASIKSNPSHCGMAYCWGFHTITACILQLTNRQDAVSECRHAWMALAKKWTAILPRHYTRLHSQPMRWGRDANSIQADTLRMHALLMRTVLCTGMTLLRIRKNKRDTINLDWRQRCVGTKCANVHRTAFLQRLLKLDQAKSHPLPLSPL